MRIRLNIITGTLISVRILPPMCQSRNTGLRSDNTSGVKGVCVRVSKIGTVRFSARITLMGEDAYLGIFASFTEAVCHRYAAEQCLNWAGCDSSSPAYLYLKERGIIK